MMKSHLRVFATYCLLLLLPLQSAAAMKVYACALSMVSNTTAEIAMSKSMPNCEFNKAKTILHGDSFANHQHTTLKSDISVKSDAGSCKMSATCSAIILIATLPCSQNIAAQFGSEPLRIFIPSAYLSFVPDGLQRPPNLPA